MRTGRPRPSRRRAVRALAAGLVAVGLAAPLAGCDLRTESAPPVAPSPDAVERVRGGQVARSVGLEQAAQAALTTPAGSAKVVAAVLTDVAAFSARHATELGGTYRSGLPDDSASPLPTTTAATPATPAQVLAALVGARDAALGDADGVGDGGLARLLASVGTSRAELATRLAVALRTKVPASSAAAKPAASTPAPGPTPTAGTPFTDADAQALVRAQDQAGYGFEVVAAQLSGAERTRAVAAAARHRLTAAELAADAGIAGTPDDPRRAAYTLPAGLSDPKVVRTLARSLETSLADAYATAVAHTSAGQRADAVAGLRAATADARTWGAAAVAFPGMPELAQDHTG
ncbi:DUF4439 domain-containing protein [Cellulomonas alba]|uniref:DUF4439 domain-containing protein n=1 Tax=Cellulomonas alba TaxID=3053467 RepID=A0ABT7SIU1_9CELL|nr:DUF4439 domain-containing protein [Cellulomonas alba]MDM7856104.1 DUF4439 domain-containing protein [Cellulomonas alba]